MLPISCQICQKKVEPEDPSDSCAIQAAALSVPALPVQAHLKVNYQEAQSYVPPDDQENQEDFFHLDDGHHSLNLHIGKLNPFQVLLAPDNHMKI